MIFDQEFTYFGKATRSTVVKTTGFLTLTKVMLSHDRETILQFWLINVDNITLDLVLDLIMNHSLNL